MKIMSTGRRHETIYDIYGGDSCRVSDGDACRIYGCNTVEMRDDGDIVEMRGRELEPWYCSGAFVALVIMFILLGVSTVFGVSLGRASHRGFAAYSENKKKSMLPGEAAASTRRKKQVVLNETENMAIRYDSKKQKPETQRPLLVTRIDSETGRMTIELGSGMVIVLVSVLIVICLIVLGGYGVFVHLNRKEKEE